MRSPGTIGGMTGLLLPPVSYDRTSVRPGWEQLPPTLHASLADHLGAVVSRARVSGTGFTPGFAAVLTTEDGKDHFIKAAPKGSDVAQWYAQEAVFTAALPAGVPAAPLRWATELSGFFVLCFDAIPGAHAPAMPWSTAGLDAALSAVAQAHAALANPPRALLELEPTPWDEVVADALTNWASSTGEHPHLDELRQLEAGFHSQTRDATGLFHCDLRLDNIVLDDAGRAWICDWNWLAYGPPWFDLVTLLLTAEGSGFDTDALFAAHPLGAGVSPELLDAALASLAGFYTHAAQRPGIDSSPHIRTHQGYYRDLAMHWLSRRRGWSH